MVEKFKVTMVGHIKITEQGGEVLLEQSNTIGPDALAIITRCLTQLDYPKQIDSIKASGSFGTFTQNITQAIYDPILNNITFRAIFYEDDFSGNIDNLELLCVPMGNAVLAQKTGLSITKDNETRIQIDWTININLC